MQAFAPYTIALIALALFALVGQVLSGMVGMTRAKAGLLPGVLPTPDLDDRGYRIGRAYHNTTDNAGTFVAAVAAAILTGASPMLVNLFAGIAILARLGFVVSYVRGIGAADGGARSVLYVVNSVMTMLLALTAILAGIA